MSIVPRFLAGFFSFIIVFSTITAFGVDRNTALKIIDEIEKHKSEIIRVRRFIHMNPELGNREYQTASLVASKLMAMGLEVKTSVAKTGVTGLLAGEEEGFTIALRADMDALPIQELADVSFRSLNPGVMHACGHDLHTSIALGTAMVLNTMKNKIKGNIKFIFQPAEEGPPPGERGGAQLMIEEGVLDEPPIAAILGLHVWPGNVGELRNHIQRAVVMAEGSSITPDDLGLGETEPVENPFPFHTADGTLNLKKARGNLEREMVELVLKKHSGKITAAAAELGVARPTFYDLMDRHEISRI